MQEQETEFGPFEAFLAVAREFCRFVDQIEQYDQSAAFEYFRKMLPLLYVKGCMVKPPAEFDESFMQRVVTEEAYESVFNALRTIAADKDVFYVLDQDIREPVQASTAECLTDIYQDLRDLLFSGQHALEPVRLSAAGYLHQWLTFRWGHQVAVLMPVFHDYFEKKATGSQSGTEFD